MILSADCDADRAILESLSAADGHVFELHAGPKGAALSDLGATDEALGRPINITRSSPAPYAEISNLAATPFLLDGEVYGSVEGFWQSLKFPDEKDRRRVGALDGGRAKKNGDTAPPAGLTFDYQGQTIVTGTHGHWTLMKRACLAKFEQDERARRALMATGERPLTHRVPKDSRTIPGVIMADIWMRVRAILRGAGGMEGMDD